MAGQGDADGEVMHGRVCMGAYGRGQGSGADSSRGAASRAAADDDDEMRTDVGDEGEVLDRGWGRNGRGKVARAAAATDADDAYASDTAEDGELMARPVRRGRGSKSCGPACSNPNPNPTPTPIRIPNPNPDPDHDPHP